GLRGPSVKPGPAGAAGGACRAPGAHARRPPLEARRLRPTPLAAGRARRRLRNHLGSDGRRLRDDARRILLREARRPVTGRDRARRRHLCPRLRHPRTVVPDSPDPAGALIALPGAPKLTDLPWCAETRAALTTVWRDRYYRTKPTKTLGGSKMRVALSLLLAMALMPIVSMQTANAQDNAVYVVTYVDVAPAARATAANLL